MSSEELLQGVDYYFDQDGLFVFTREFHLRRGYCCNNDCRNCPFGEKEIKK
ncbi:MAG: DUF5522 domain-containing protein [Candidatus Omnitrophota bacterium]